MNEWKKGKNKEKREKKERKEVKKRELQIYTRHMGIVNYHI